VPTSQEILSEQFSASAIATGLTPPQADLLGKLAEYREYQDGEVVMDDRDESNSLFVLLQGRASVQGTFQQEMNTAEQGAVLGELSFLDKKPRSATVRSIGTSQYAILSQELLAQLEVNHPEILARVLYNISISLCGKLRSTLRMVNALSASL
jgi:CRP-like cAMP-binding protein